MVSVVTFGGHQIYTFLSARGMPWRGFERDAMAGRHQLLKDLVAARQGLQRYYQDVKATPNDLHALTAAIGQPGWRGPYITLPLGFGDYRIDPDQVLLMHGRFDTKQAFQDCRFDQLTIPAAGKSAECAVWLVVMEASPAIVDYLVKPPVHAGLVANNMLYLLLSASMPGTVPATPPISVPNIGVEKPVAAVKIPTLGTQHPPTDNPVVLAPAPAVSDSIPAPAPAPTTSVEAPIVPLATATPPPAGPSIAPQDGLKPPKKRKKKIVQPTVDPVIVEKIEEKPVEKQEEKPVSPSSAPELPSP